MLTAFLVLITVVTSLLLLFQRLSYGQLLVARRLEELGSAPKIMQARQAELSVPIGQRILQPLSNRLRQKQKPSTPSQQALARRLQAAGNPGGLTTVEFVAVRYILASAGLALGLFLAFFGVPIPNALLLAVGSVLAGWMLPIVFLNLYVNHRREEVQKTLPDTLDLLTVSVEAGLSFDGAVQKVVDKTRGPLASEMREMLKEIQVGKPRKEALKDVAERVGVDDLTTFIGAMIMAEQMGVGICNVMRVQSDQMRLKRRQKAQEKALKAPVKMLFPLVFFIFPATFIILLGPAVIQILRSF